MSIDSNTVPNIIYLLYDVKTNINMSEATNDDNSNMNANNDDDNATNSNVVDIENKTNESSLVILNGNSNGVDHIIDGNRIDVCNDDDIAEVVVVTDGSVVTGPSTGPSKERTPRKKTTLGTSSPSSNLRSKSSPRVRTKPTPLNFTSTTKIISNKKSKTNKRKSETPNHTSKTKKSSISSSNTTPSSKKTNTTPSPTTMLTTPTNTNIKASETNEFTTGEMQGFEAEMNEARINHDNDKNNDELYTEYKQKERSFDQKLFHLIPRTSNKAVSIVWKKYCKEIKLTPFAEQYYKTGK